MKSAEKYIERWRRKGLVDDELAEVLLADVRAGAHASSRLPMVLGIMGAVLLIAGVLSFVAANWQDMGHLARVVLLLAALGGALLATAWLHQRKLDWLAESAGLLAAGLFGANIWLIAQMYHIEGRASDFFFAWGIGALLIAVLLCSQGAMVLAMGLLGYWIWAVPAAVPWLFLPLWGGAAAVIWLNNWRFATHAALLALAAWLYAASLQALLGWQVVIGAALLVAGLAMSRKADEREEIFHIVAAYGAAFTVLAVVLVQHYGQAFLWIVTLILRGKLVDGLSGFLLVQVLVLALILGWGYVRRLLAPLDLVALAGAFLMVAVWPSVLSEIDDTTFYWIYALAVLLLVAWLMLKGVQLRRHRLVRLGYVLFALECC